ncbi:DUF6578 domain-containing protein [Streptomyces mangrovisoli]|uniref:Uncharacterized protein n=1 Tax=Streptomyces mangrovisoli TaxID=1428628 RepID=A0A1J4NMU2_9ACTN|nr:DUF6578 domain-containing protein [Streptomyces mangrovisoli]OIJ63619.1 hypothetical protein WN71_032880 [Streptomyces mangrovisoli]
MGLTIWVDDWQMQCCGKTFRQGDAVSWTLLEVDPEDYADVVGDERAAGIDFREEHHGQDEGHAPTRLQVLAISEVHCRYATPAGSSTNVLAPVPGSAVLVSVEQGNGWAKAQPGVSFAGYLVTARPAPDMPETAGRRSRRSRRGSQESR